MWICFVRISPCDEMSVGHCTFWFREELRRSLANHQSAVEHGCCRRCFPLKVIHSLHSNMFGTLVEFGWGLAEFGRESPLLADGGDCVPLCRGQGSIRMPVILGSSRISVKWPKSPKWGRVTRATEWIILIWQDLGRVLGWGRGGWGLKRGTGHFFVYLSEWKTPWYFRAKSCHPGGIVRCSLSAPTAPEQHTGHFFFVWY